MPHGHRPPKHAHQYGKTPAPQGPPGSPPGAPHTPGATAPARTHEEVEITVDAEIDVQFGSIGLSPASIGAISVAVYCVWEFAEGRWVARKHGCSVEFPCAGPPEWAGEYEGQMKRIPSTTAPR